MRDTMAGMDVPVIDNLQYANWSETVFDQMRDGNVAAIHATVAYHETFPEIIDNLISWNRRFAQFPDRIMRATSAADVRTAQASGRTAVLFGLQNPAAIGADLGMVEILHQLGLRFMQVTYNMQSLLGSGCYEAIDSGLTRFGREVVAEMNRVGLAVDLSHASHRTMRDAIATSGRPVAITHANPNWWHDVPRNVPDDVLRDLVAHDGILGFSLYPHHLADGSACSLGSFCRMVAECAERYGVEHLGIGSDLCQDQPDEVVQWMRAGRWTRSTDEGAAFPDMPVWFKGNADFPKLVDGLAAVGFAGSEVEQIMSGNWLRFYETAFEPQIATRHD